MVSQWEVSRRMPYDDEKYEIRLEQTGVGDWDVKVMVYPAGGDALSKTVLVETTTITRKGALRWAKRRIKRRCKYIEDYRRDVETRARTREKLPGPTC